jgi:hypothetical protein
MNKREKEALQRVERDPRRQWGWEPSPMASVEEQRAYQAYEMLPKVAAGELPVSALPEAYGGRPTGTSRRAIRMAAEYDLAQTARLQQEQAMRQQAEFDRQAEISAREELVNVARRESQIAGFKNAQKITAETEIQKARFLPALGELDPRSPTFLDDFRKISKGNGLALVSPEVKAQADQYLEINKIYRDQDEVDAAEAINKKAARDQQLAQLTKLAKLTNRNLSDLAQSDMETEELVVDPVAVGEAEAELATKPAKEITDPAASVLRQEAKELRGSIRDIELNIVTAQTEFQSATNDKTRNAAQMRLAELTAQRNLLYTDLQGVDSVLAGAGQEAPKPAVQKPTNAQIESARRGAIDQAKSQAFRDANIRFLQDNGIQVEAATPEPQAPTNPEAGPTPPTRPAPPPEQPEPTIENSAPAALKQELQNEQTLREERDRLYKAGYRFSSNKKQRELYGSVTEQLTKARENKNKEKYKRITEIRKRMKEIGTFSSDPKLREEYSRLQQEREVLLGA